MLYAKKSKKTKKHYLCYNNVYGSVAFPDRFMISDETLYLFGGITIKCPDGEEVHCLTRNDIKNLLNHLDFIQE